jgi:hypothetical protein
MTATSDGHFGFVQLPKIENHLRRGAHMGLSELIGPIASGYIIALLMTDRNQ